MSTPTIAAKHRWTAEEMARSNRAHSKQSHGPIPRLGLHALSLTSMLLLAGSFWTLVKAHFENIADLIPIYLMVPAVFGFIYFGIYADRQMGRLFFRLMPENSKDVEWTFSEHGLETRTPLTTGAYSWALVTKVVENPQGFLIYRNQFLFDWIPARAFASPVDIRRFATLAEERSPRYILVGECDPSEAMIADLAGSESRR